MVSFTKMNTRGLLIILVILFSSLAISIVYPFYNGIKEGLTAAELDPAAPIKSGLLTYSNTVESNCQGFINSYGSIAGLGQSDIASINGINGNTNFTNTAKFQQIIALNSKNAGLLEAINTVQGKNFTALISLLQALPTNTNDTVFNSMVNKFCFLKLYDTLNESIK